MFTIINQSTLVSDADVKLMTRAVAHQVRYDAAPIFGLTPVPVVFATSAEAAPPGSYVIAILDDPDQAGALGWHTEDQGDIVYGEVFARPVLDNGGDALTRQLSIASVLSHEVLETLCDPHANLWADNGHGVAYAYEVGDPVESDSYTVNVSGHQVTVSNFVTAAWFDPQAAKGQRFDFMGRVTAPFQMTKGGYVVLMQEGRVTQKFGEELPEWRKGMKRRPNGGRRTV
jgi:hypothetical protein